MIEKIGKKDIENCVKVIKASFLTVAEEFKLTAENAPRFTAFAVNEERLIWQLEQEKRLMFKYCRQGEIIGFYSLFKQNENECELNNLCVSEQYRHCGIGGQLLLHSFEQAAGLGCEVMNIGIVDENLRLRKWYESYGFTHIAAEKYDFFPFTCGYMAKRL